MIIEELNLDSDEETLVNTSNLKKIQYLMNIMVTFSTLSIFQMIILIINLELFCQANPLN